MLPQVNSITLVEFEDLPPTAQQDVLFEMFRKALRYARAAGMVKQFERGYFTRHTPRSMYIYLSEFINKAKES
jgi:hypothetical protein